MTHTDIIYQRLINQQIATTAFTKPQQVAGYMMAMQAQEYASAKWGIGLRLPGSTEAAIEQALNEGHILRTHIMRPTWHFVAPADIRWLQQLTAHRVHAFNASMCRKEGLDAKTMNKCMHIIHKQLQGGNHLTRTALLQALDYAGIKASGIKAACIMMHAELECLVCNGPRDDKQHTYALLDELVPGKAAQFERDEALATLALRYFTSRAPATAKDFAWWCGLTLKDCNAAIAMLPAEFEKMTIDGQEYVTGPMHKVDKKHMQATFLMPGFDEYGISYKDRSLLKGGKETHELLTKNGWGIPTIIVDGLIAGTWKVATNSKNLSVETHTYTPLTKTKQHALAHAVKRYTDFYK